MKLTSNASKLAQSASALGAGILGFGLGSEWGIPVSSNAFIIIIAGAVFHVWGMYIMQLKNPTKNTELTAKLLWVSAWICLMAVIVIIVYLITSK